MKKKLILFLLIVHCGSMISQVNMAQESINSFSFKLFNQLYSKNENCFFSPYSAFGALSMVYTGAKGETKRDIEKALEIKNGEDFLTGYKSLSGNIQLDRETRLLSSNSIWLQKSLKLEKEYSKLVDENFQAKCKNVDFTNPQDREKTRNEMNELVEKHTAGNIKSFLKPGVLDESTSMVLINAVYFKANWQVEFSEKETSQARFLSAKGDSVDCRMMKTNLKTKYFEDGFAQWLEIPYENNKVSMIVILPKDSSKTEVKDVNLEYLTGSLKAMTMKEVDLHLPAFKLSVDYEFSDPLKKIGLKSAFEPGADFSGIVGKKDLVLNKILHKSVIEVNEKGTEASSSTAVIAMRSTKLPSQGPVVFRADHPFVFIIRDNNSNVNLFIGYLANPN
ncbi:MAG: serpin family protein [Bacteroidales bacterium]